MVVSLSQWGISTPSNTDTITRGVSLLRGVLSHRNYDHQLMLVKPERYVSSQSYRQHHHQLMLVKPERYVSSHSLTDRTTTKYMLAALILIPYNRKTVIGTDTYFSFVYIF